jgi:hypothetical protein
MPTQEIHESTKIRDAWKNVIAAIEAIPDTDATTTSYFWDCECKEDFIHEAGDYHCDRCGIEEPERFSQPNSRLREALILMIKGAIQ